MRSTLISRPAPRAPFVSAVTGRLGRRLVRTVGFGLVVPGGLAGCDGLEGGSLHIPRAVPTPVIAGDGLRLTAISSGFFHTCGLDAEGQAWCWGDNAYRQLGTEGPTVACDATSECVMRPVRVATDLRFQAISTSHTFTCALTMDGAAVCWGGGYEGGGAGNLGTGQPRRSATPVAVAGGHRFLALDAGENHVCGVTTDHAAYCWGRNDHDQLGVAFGATRDVPSPVLGGLRFVSVSAGKDFTCGVTVSGALWCWGENGQGQLGAGHQWDLNRPVTVQNPREASRPSR